MSSIDNESHRSSTVIRQFDDTQKGSIPFFFRSPSPFVFRHAQPSNPFVLMDPLAIESLAFLPDFVEHPKPRKKKIKAAVRPGEDPQALEQRRSPPVDDNDDISEDDVTFFHDLIAGGMAGSASVIVGHPFDTIKVRMQTASSPTAKLNLADFGGPLSLFRGMAAPLASAAVINALVFSSYGAASRLYDQYVPVTVPVTSSNDDTDTETDVDPSGFVHDPWRKSSICGSFAGLVQCLIICPMEHVKCRLQTQTAASSSLAFAGPWQATKTIAQNHGLTRLYQGWWATCWREVPAFGLYFASYDYFKDRANAYLNQRDPFQLPAPANPHQPHTHTWLASAWAGGCAGSITWAIVYPLDVIKTRIQTAPFETPRDQLRIFNMGQSLVRQYGWRYLFRGLNVTLVRAFPVNGTIFPVYELVLNQIKSYENHGSASMQCI